MRMLLRATIPVESGNAAANDGCRTALFFVNLEGEWQIRVMVEPWFIGLNAKIELLPAMNAQDCSPRPHRNGQDRQGLANPARDAFR